MATTTHQPKMLPMGALSEAAACMKILAHPVRLRIVDILMQGEFPVREIAELCGERPHQVCEHLRLMKSHGLLAAARRGQVVHYKIATPRLPSLLACIKKSCPADAGAAPAGPAPRPARKAAGRSPNTTNRKMK